MVRAIDCDGVLADFNTPFIALVKEQTGIELPAPSATYPNTWNYHRAAGVNAKQDAQLWAYIKESDFWETLPPTKDCAAAIARLRECRGEGDEIYFITSRPGKYAKHLTEFWLDAQGYECPTVLISSDKGPVCQGLEVDVFVDDKIDNCNEVADCCDDARVFLLDAPYNRDESRILFANITRITSLHDPRLYSLEVPNVVAA